MAAAWQHHGSSSSSWRIAVASAASVWQHGNGGLMAQTSIMATTPGRVVVWHIGSSSSNLAAQQRLGSVSANSSSNGMAAAADAISISISSMVVT